MSKIPISFPVQDFIALFLSHCCLFQSWGLMVGLDFACARSGSRRRRSRHRGSERLRLGEIRCRGPVIAEHEFNFGAIPVGEREICSEFDTAVEVIPGAVQIADLSTRETALIENLRVVWIEPDQRVE